MAGGCVGADGGISRVCEGACRAGAEAGDIVLIAAEVLLFRCSSERESALQDRSWVCTVHILQFEGAELLVDNLPNNLIRRHGDVDE